MSQIDTTKLGNVVSNVFEMVKRVTTGDICISTELRAAQIKVTGLIIAALIDKDKTIYYDH